MDPLCEGGGVELGADNLVGAVGENGDTPVADEGDELLMLGSFNLGAHAFGRWDTALAFHVDEDQIIMV